jgi:hypothetical protein
MMDSAPAPWAPALVEQVSSGPQAPEGWYSAQPPAHGSLVGGWSVGEKLPGRRVWASGQVAWPGILSRSTAASRAPQERNSGSERPGFAWHYSKGHFHFQWKEEACCDPPSSPTPSYAPETGRPPGHYRGCSNHPSAGYYRVPRRLCQRLFGLQLFPLHLPYAVSCA